MSEKFASVLAAFVRSPYRSRTSSGPGTVHVELIFFTTSATRLMSRKSQSRETALGGHEKRTPETAGTHRSPGCEKKNHYKSPMTMHSIVVGDGYPASDASWVGVWRMAPLGQGDNSCDGWCPGFLDEPKRSRNSYAQILSIPYDQPVNYGCWFYMFIGASNHSHAAVPHSSIKNQHPQQ